MTRDPRSANDYDDRTTQAVKRVLVEIGQVLGSYRGRFVVVGGSVPWLLLDNADMPHVGTFDSDLVLDAEALGDGEYAKLIQSLIGRGFKQSPEARRFQLIRTVAMDDGAAPIDVIVDFLMPRDAVVQKNKPALVADFAVQKADGARLALTFNDLLEIEAKMPEGGINRVKIAVVTIPAFLAMKGHALSGRDKEKDSYDVYYAVRNFPGGMPALAEVCRPVLEHGEGMAGFRIIAEKFASLERHGPVSVRHFVEGSQALGDRTPDQWQQDAFGQVDELMRMLGLASSGR